MKTKIRNISLIMSIFMMYSTMLPQDFNKCSACQAAKSIRDTLAQSIKDVQMAALAAGGSFSREKELDEAQVKCGCRTTRDELAADIETEELAKCGCRTTRDEFAADLDTDETVTVAACCEFCAQPGSLGCQGANSARCNTCQQGLLKLARAGEVSRAPREELIDPCDPCGEIEAVDSCILHDQLRALRCCCASVAQTLSCQGKAAERCCKQVKHKLNDVKDVLGEPTDWALNFPLCQPDIFTTVNNTEADIITWLKSIYVLLYTLHQCSCCTIT